MPPRNLELVGKRELEAMMREGNIGRMGTTDIGASNGDGQKGRNQDGPGEALPERGGVVIDPERNDALEKERPADALFKAVFGSDSEDD